MISVSHVKQRIVDLMSTRELAATAAILYGMPQRESDLAGTDPVVRQMIGFDNPEGDFQVTEMCGPTISEYFETYTVDVMMQVVGRTMDATPYVVERRLGQLQWELLQCLQDPTLALATNPDPDGRISQLYVVAGQTVALSGWLPSGGGTQAASRVAVTLEVETKVTNE